MSDEKMPATMLQRGDTIPGKPGDPDYIFLESVQKNDYKRIEALKKRWTNLTHAGEGAVIGSVDLAVPKKDWENMLKEEVRETKHSRKRKVVPREAKAEIAEKAIIEEEVLRASSPRVSHRTSKRSKPDDNFALRAASVAIKQKELGEKIPDPMPSEATVIPPVQVRRGSTVERMSLLELRPDPNSNELFFPYEIEIVGEVMVKDLNSVGLSGNAVALAGTYRAKKILLENVEYLVLDTNEKTSLYGSSLAQWKQRAGWKDAPHFRVTLKEPPKESDKK